MTCTVLLNRPIKAEIRAVDSQSDLTICYSYDDDNDDDDDDDDDGGDDDDDDDYYYYSHYYYFVQM